MSYREIWIIAVSTGIFFSGCTERKVKFKPVLVNNTEIVLDTLQDSKEFFLNVTRVLNHERIEYEFDSLTEILIPQSLFNNKERIYNITKKALDTNWLNKNGSDKYDPLGYFDR